MNINLKNRNILIIGASKGLGEYLSRYFFDYNCKLLLVARNEEKLKNISRDLSPKCDYISLDMMKDNSVDALYNYIQKIKFDIDIIIHNMGGALGRKDPISEKKEFFDVWNFNVGIQIDINNRLIPKMKKKNFGRIISVSSILAKNSFSLKPFGGSIQYNSAKAYLNHYNKCLSKELAEFGIVVSTVMPGVILSDGKYWDKMKKTNPELVENFLNNHVSAKRFCLYEEIAPFILLLCSDYASYCSGTEINIDGGWK